MGSTRQQDRLLGGGISLPQWMKGKTDNRFDFDDTTFSPPSHDDSFFYVRYPKGQNRFPVSQDYRPIEDAFGEEKAGASSTNNVKIHKQEVKQQITEEEKKKNKEIDFSKHPLPCQPFVPTASKEKTIVGGSGRAKGSGASIENSKVAKSQGIDDGFHGEPALCGKSIVLVASQMMSNRFHESFSAEQAAGGGGQPKKGSKSLPATPLTSPTGSPSSSPKARRRVPSNRYFTGPFLLDREKYQGGWILGSILGQSKDIVTPKIDEEDETGTEIAAVPPSRALSRKKSISSQNLTYVGSDEKSADKPVIYSNAFQAKPSELREMNFWSPTSM